jgi:8-hydroxy-5-deazaflavin:NADPH oxidoreductase
MLFCGNDAGAKNTIAGIIDQLGWKPLDVGGVERALHLEHMTLLWVKMVRVNRRFPNFVWAMLER